MLIITGNQTRQEYETIAKERKEEFRLAYPGERSPFERL